MNTRNICVIFCCFSLIFFPYLTAAADDMFCNTNDKAALIKIRDHFGGPTGPLSDWNTNSDCCTDWSFIGCQLEYEGEPGRVTDITIGRFSGLSGSLPAEFGDLPFLSFLSLSDEPGVTGPIPQSFSQLKNLQKLELDSSGLSGPIPGFLGQLKGLQELDLSNNRFTGNIPASLGTLPGLTTLNVSHNMLSGSIPNLPTSLTTLDVSFNQLCGAIPSGLSKFGASVFGHNKCLCGVPLPAC